MSATAATAIRTPGKYTTLLSAVWIVLVGAVLQVEFSTRQTLLFLIGIGLGYTLYHAA